MKSVGKISEHEEASCVVYGEKFFSALEGGGRKALRVNKANTGNITVLLVLIIILALAGCSSSGTVPPSASANDKAAELEESVQRSSTAVISESNHQNDAVSFSAPIQQPTAKDGANSKEESKTVPSSTAGNTKNTGVNLIKARVMKVVDGDTVYIKLENGKEEKVRFIGVDTPESTTQVEPYGKEAAAYTKSKLLNKDVWLELDVQERDKYGRLLAYIWLSPPIKESDEEVRTKMFNAMLLLEGYAQVMTVPPNVKYAEYFRTYQQEAREKNAGLWGLEIKEESESSNKASASYIGNKNSKKFHFPDCQWAKKIAPGNRVYFKSREEAIKAGYEPCKVCKP
jgi:micrococcal nuclease